MKGEPVRRRIRRRVYYIPVLLFSTLWVAATAPAQVELTVNSAMTKGPLGAPVVIVAFSDYQ